MRDLLILGIIVFLSFVALRRPWIGAMLWTWLSIMNPHRYTYGFAYSMPVAAMAGASTLIGLIFTRERQSPFKGAPVLFFVLFFIWMTITWRLGIDPAGDYELWDKVMKIDLMILVTLALVINKYQIVAFISICVGSLAVLGSKGGLFTILHAGNYKVWGPPGSYIEGNNEFALALIMIIPLIYFLYQQADQFKWIKQALMLAILLCAASAIGSYSRGAFLALIAMGIMFWWRSKQKGTMTLLVLIVGLAMIPMMPEQWFSRMETISAYEEDQSAMGRINAWIVAWEVAKSHFFGAGMSYQHDFLFATFGPYEAKARAAHSIYFQVLGNHGFIGLILFLMVFVSTYRTAGWLRKHGRDQQESSWAADLGAMIQVGLIGYAVGGAFLSLAYFDLPYNMMIMAVVTKHWVVTKGWERDPKVPFVEYLGFKKRAAPSHRQKP